LGWTNELIFAWALVWLVFATGLGREPHYHARGPDSQRARADQRAQVQSFSPNVQDEKYQHLFSNYYFTLPNLFLSMKLFFGYYKIVV
jgi:hypothetical protein